MRWLHLALGVLAALGVACERKAAPEPIAEAPQAKTTAQSLPTALPTAIPSRFAAAKRVIAIGDVHGDLPAARAALKLGGLIDDGDRWSGGDTVLVQTGDILDRGDGEQAILDLFAELMVEAKKAGGAMHVMHGNHELMNVAGDFRYVTPGGFRDFDDVRGLRLDKPALSRVPEAQRARYAAFLPGGVYAKRIARHPVVLVVGDSVFAHGGVLPKHVKYGIEKLNLEVALWMLGASKVGQRVVMSSDSPVWSRHFSDEPDDDDCKMLGEVLEQLKAKRMVVGHTVQKSISSACDERVWRIDVGMASHYGGQPEVLEITAEGVRPIRDSAAR